MLNRFPPILPALLWTTLLTVLLCLPGEKIPSGGLLNIPHLDKPVHFILFGILTIAWCYFIWKKMTATPASIQTFYTISFLSLVYGVIMEFVQANFIPHRSFDYWDIVADAIGSIAGGWWSTRRYIKK
ncbi:MAG: VanZ family protein [Chitinophagales bacterium]|nr:VanZ family protein [Chitinophagales bacterium]